jgi:hypothetical protein
MITELHFPRFGMRGAIPLFPPHYTLGCW